MHKKKLSCAVLAALASMAANAQETDADARAKIETIEVTATKRTESIQDIPVAVTALNGEALENLGVDNFQDYVEFLPNVVFQGTGPGQNEIYIRGAATTQTSIAVSSVQAIQPAVAFYLDEQPVSMQGRNLDIFATDIQRIEVLPGPQGTLFGASSQSGTVRLITNKPDHSGFSAGIDTDLGFTKGGEMSNTLEAYFNFAVTDDFAVRVAMYNDRQGGWIDNVLNDPANGGYGGSVEVIRRVSGYAGSPGVLEPSTTAISAPTNDELVEDDFNDATYTGARVGASYHINDDWHLLVQHTEQTLDTEGVFAYDPNLDGTSSANRFVPEENSDEFGLTTWTLEGRLKKLDIVYTGGYLDREINSTIDYTGYTNGGSFSAFYTCLYSGLPAEEQACFDPTGFYLEETSTTRLTHEFRVNTDAEERWRLTAGVFYDDQEVASVGQFQLGSLDIPGFRNNSAMLAGTEGINSNGGPFSPEVSFVNDVTHTIEQIAVFGQLDFDITDTLTASFGARWYEIEDEYKGATTTADVSGRLRAFGSGEQAILNFPGLGQDYIDAINAGQLDVSLLDRDGVLTVDDTIFKFGLDWKVTEDILLFTNYSEGFRPPVTNRVGGNPATSTEGAFADFRIPVYSLTDTLDNYEIGMKGDFLDGILRVNATAFYSEITDLQTSRFDPTNISFLVFTDNVGDAEIRGLDADITWLATDDLIIDAAFSLLDTELVSLNPELVGIAPPVGSRLPYSAEFSGNIRARYFYELENGMTGFVNASVSYTGDRLMNMTADAFVFEDASQLIYGRGSGLEIERELSAADYAGVNYLDRNGNAFEGGRYVAGDYAIANLVFGLTNDEWKAELYIDNVFDESATLHIDTQQFTPKVITNRPRTIGLRFSYDFL